MYIYLSLGRLLQALKAEIKVYSSVYKIMHLPFTVENDKNSG